jgi:hypothetical protein
MEFAKGGTQRSGPALEKMYRFMLWLVPTVDKLPRSQKFLLGDRIQQTALCALEGIVEATYSKSSGPILAQVNLALERLRILFRLTFDLQFIDMRRYEFASRAIDEVGRLVGGWKKAGHEQTS